MDLTSFVDTMELLLSLEKKRVAVWEKELESLPEGNLHLVDRGNKTYFQLAIGDHRQGISNDIDLIYRLARKRYLQLLLQDRQEALKESAAVTSVGSSKASANRKKHADPVRYSERSGLHLLPLRRSDHRFGYVQAGGTGAQLLLPHF